MRKAVDAPRSVNQQNYVKTQENPKFQELMQRIQTSKEVGSKMHPSSAQRRAVDVPKIRCVKFNNNADFDDSEPETEIDSLYDNTNFHEAQSESLNSESEYEGEFDDSFESLQNGIKTITNKYVQKVQSRVDNAMSKLKLQEKVKHAKPPKKVVGERGAGDIKSIRNEEVYKKMEAVKKECYRKIEANLTILKHIDTINDELFLSRMSKKY